MVSFEIIGLISSVASIVSIPLAFYFERKSRLTKYEYAKRRIIEALLHQIGSGQKIDLIGMTLIKNSKLAEEGLQPSKIDLNEIIADLYTNVTTNPLIESNQKGLYQDQIKQLGFKQTINEMISAVAENKTLTTGEKASAEMIKEIENADDKSKKKFVREHRTIKVKDGGSFILNEKSRLRLYSFLSLFLTVVGSLLEWLLHRYFLQTQEEGESIFISILISIGIGLSITFLSELVAKNRVKANMGNGFAEGFINIDVDEKQP